MSEKYKFGDAQGIYFVTLTVVYWIDLFTRKEIKHLIVKSLQHCQQNKGLVIHAWCVMPSHIHMIISSKQDSLPGIMRDFKKFTSKEIIELINDVNESRKDWLIRAFANAAKNLKRIKKYKVWQDGNQPKQLETNHFIEQKLNYVQTPSKNQD